MTDDLSEAPSRLAAVLPVRAERGLAVIPDHIVVPPPKRSRFMRWAAILALLVIAAAVAYWFLLPPEMIVVSPHRGQAVQAVYATGTVEPTVMIPIAARSTARLVELNVDEGSSVTKGQVLARLENDDLRRATEAVEAEERYAKAALDRAAQLAERNIVAQSAYDRARADWEKNRALAAQLSAQASYLQLMAPADGTLIRRDGEIGQTIAANQTVFWLSCCAPLRISAEVDEEDIPQVRAGQRVLIRSDAFPERTFEGIVHSITPKGDPIARSYRVRVSLPDDTPLMIGMTTETNIILRRVEHALLVPASAVRDGAVWRSEGDRIWPRKVTIGAKGSAEIEIIEGIEETDRIVASPPADMKSGQRIRPAVASLAAERR